MSRTYRLFELLQMLRRRRRPVSGAELAREAGVSLRTLYRDVAALQAMGAEVDGEPGVGYVLRPGFLLPPLMFSEEELEALALGAKWVARRTDDALSDAARNAMTKIAAVLPQDLKIQLRTTPLSSVQAGKDRIMSNVWPFMVCRDAYPRPDKGRNSRRRARSNEQEVSGSR